MFTFFRYGNITFGQTKRESGKIFSDRGSIIVIKKLNLSGKSCKRSAIDLKHIKQIPKVFRDVVIDLLNQCARNWITPTDWHIHC